MGRTKEKKPHNGFILRSFFKLAFFAFIVYALVTIVATQVNLSDRKQQLSDLQTQANELKAKNDDCERLLNVDDEKKYMEQIAMDKLGYSYPNETRFYDVSKN